MLLDFIYTHTHKHTITYKQKFQTFLYNLILCVILVSRREARPIKLRSTIQNESSTSPFHVCVECLRGLKCTCKPPAARIVIRNIGLTVRLPLTGTNSNCRKMLDITVFISMYANLLPMQFRGPAENGIKAYGCRFSHCFGEKRSGSKRSGSG